MATRKLIPINNKSGTIPLKEVVTDSVTLAFINLWRRKMNSRVVALYNPTHKQWSLLLFHANCRFTEKTNNCVKHHIHLVHDKGSEPVLLIKGKAKHAVDSASFKTGKALYQHVIAHFGELLKLTD
jgi:hypothetical protein